MKKCNYCGNTLTKDVSCTCWEALTQKNDSILLFDEMKLLLEDESTQPTKENSITSVSPFPLSQKKKPSLFSLQIKVLCQELVSPFQKIKYSLHPKDVSLLTSSVLLLFYFFSLIFFFLSSYQALQRTLSVNFPLTPIIFVFPFLAFLLHFLCQGGILGLFVYLGEPSAIKEIFSFCVINTFPWSLSLIISSFLLFLFHSYHWLSFLVIVFLMSLSYLLSTYQFNKRLRVLIPSNYRHFVLFLSISLETALIGLSFFSLSLNIVFKVIDFLLTQ